MKLVKSPNPKIVKHNLRHALKIAVFANDLHAVAEAAQAVLDAGYELEDLDFTPAFFDGICSQIIRSGWVPKHRGEK